MDKAIRSFGARGSCLFALWQGLEGNGPIWGESCKEALRFVEIG